MGIKSIFCFVPLCIWWTLGLAQLQPTCETVGFGAKGDVAVVTDPTHTLICPDEAYPIGIFGTADSVRVRSFGFRCSNGGRTYMVGEDKGTPFNLSCSYVDAIHKAWARFEPDMETIKGLKFECRASRWDHVKSLGMIGNFSGPYGSDFHKCSKGHVRGFDVRATGEGLLGLSPKCCTSANAPKFCKTLGFANPDVAQSFASNPTDVLVCPEGAYPNGVFGYNDNIHIRGIGFACTDGTRTSVAGSRVGEQFSAFCKPGNLINALWGDLDHNASQIRSLKFGCGLLGGTFGNRGVTEFLPMFGNPRIIRPIDFHGCKHGAANGFDIEASSTRILRLSFKCCEPTVAGLSNCDTVGFVNGPPTTSIMNPTNSLLCLDGSYPTGVFGYADSSRVRSLGFTCSNGRTTGMAGIHEGTRFERTCSGTDAIVKAWARLDAADSSVQGLKFGCGAPEGPVTRSLPILGNFTSNHEVDFHGCGDLRQFRGIDAQTDDAGLVHVSFKCCSRVAQSGFCSTVGHAKVSLGNNSVPMVNDALLCGVGAFPVAVYGYSDGERVRGLGFKCSDGSTTKFAGVAAGDRFSRRCGEKEVISSVSPEVDSGDLLIRSLKFACGPLGATSGNGGVRLLEKVGGGNDAQSVGISGCDTGTARGFEAGTTSRGIEHISTKCCEPAAESTGHCSTRGFGKGPIGSFVSEPNHTLSCPPRSYPTGVFGYSDGIQIRSLGLSCSNGQQTNLAGHHRGTRFDVHCKDADRLVKAWGRFTTSQGTLRGLKFACRGQSSSQDLYKTDMIGNFASGRGADFHGCPGSGDWQGVAIRTDEGGVVGLSFKCCHTSDKPKQCTRQGLSTCGTENSVASGPSKSLLCPVGAFPAGVHGYSEGTRVSSLGFMCSDGTITNLAGTNAGKAFEYKCPTGFVISMFMGVLGTESSDIRSFKFICGILSPISRFSGVTRQLPEIGNSTEGRKAEFLGCASGQLQGFDVEVSSVGVRRLSFRCCQAVVNSGKACRRPLYVETRVILPFGGLSNAVNYKTLFVSDSAGFRKQWRLRGFNDSSWKETRFPIGRDVSCQAVIALSGVTSPWPLGRSVLIRRVFDMDPSSFYDVKELLVEWMGTSHVRGAYLNEKASGQSRRATTPGCTEGCCNATSTESVSFEARLVRLEGNQLFLHASSGKDNSFLNLRVAALLSKRFEIAPFAQNAPVAGYKTKLSGGRWYVRGSSWLLPHYDDSKWSSSTMPMGHGVSCPKFPLLSNVATYWRPKSHLLIRREFEFPERLINHVNDIVVDVVVHTGVHRAFLNGVRAHRDNLSWNRCLSSCCSLAHRARVILPRDALTPGVNVVALVAKSWSNTQSLVNIRIGMGTNGTCY